MKILDATHKTTKRLNIMTVPEQDVVILNKTDLVKDESGHSTLEKIEREIKSINGMVKIVHSERCRVDLDDVLDCKAYGIKVILQIGSGLPLIIIMYPMACYPSRKEYIEVSSESESQGSLGIFACPL